MSAETQMKMDNLSLHEILEITEPPYFRIMKVYSGWLYNFYDTSEDAYRPDWVFVPHN